MISQGRISRGMRFFDADFRAKYKLTAYLDKNKPTVFFGCYNQTDVDAILAHHGLAVVVWGGSDAMRFHLVNQLKRKNIKHIAQSKYIANDLKQCGINSYQIPVTPFNNFSLSPTPLGNKIYIYTSELNPAFYGSDIYTRLFNVFGCENFIIAFKNTYNKTQLEQVYSSSFIGLRLVQHDGLGVTNCELGIMGRHVITNNNLPNSLNYQSFDDVVALIKNQQKNIGEHNLQLAKKMNDYLMIGNDWLNEQYYD